MVDGSPEASSSSQQQGMVAAPPNPGPSIINNKPTETTALLSQLSRRHSRRRSISSLPPGSPSSLDDLDSRFKRWKDAVAQRMGKGKAKEKEQPELLVSVFDGATDSPSTASGKGSLLVDTDLDRDVRAVRAAIEAGLLPKMIQTGSSGSYFCRCREETSGSTKTCGVFKPWDEEPYGNLNPKRAFLRKYFAWAMGRPCLIPGFSAMSEAGASILDEALGLGIVPPTKLVKLSSPSFHYAYKDRLKYEKEGVKLPEKIGSFQSFLHGFAMASTFLRQHPFPTRPRSVLERDLAEENRAHRKARKRQKATLRKCGVRLKYLLLCRGGVQDAQSFAGEEEADGNLAEEEEEVETLQEESDFIWTPSLMQSFRLELEKLVIFDFLCRNTDRGLDNFMIQHIRGGEDKADSLKIGAIDNSLSFPIKHPDGIREYPFGWLYLPADIIGQPFAASTRERFLPILTSARWWYDTEKALQNLFKQDEHYSEKLFDKQMALIKGQGWNLIESLRTEGEGPIELCARGHKLVQKSVISVSEKAARELAEPQLPASSNGAADGNALNGSMKSPAQPISLVKTGARGSAVDTDIDDSQPRSLPETSAISVARQRHGPKGGSLTAYQNALGIEVLENMNRAARQRAKDKKLVSRPAYQKSFTSASFSGARGRRQQRGTSAEPTERTGLLSATTEDNDEAEAADDGTMSPSGLTSSDYFSYGRHRTSGGRAGNTDDLPSLQSTLMQNGQASKALDPTTTSSVQAARRRRNWSVTSLGNRWQTDTQGEVEDSRTVRVIVETLIEDPSLPWQKYLGLA